MDDIDQIVEDIISELLFKEKVFMANMDKEAVGVLQGVFNLYIKNKIGSESEEEYTVIMKALWKRLLGSTVSEKFAQMAIYTLLP